MSGKEDNNGDHLASGTNGWIKFMMAQAMMPTWLMAIILGQAASIYSLGNVPSLLLHYSIYNALKIESVEELILCMKKLEKN